MKAEAKIMISKYGQSITVTKTADASPISTKAFIQPLRSDEQSELYGDYIETQGIEQFLYIGLPEIQLSACADTAVITAKNQNYIIKKAEGVNLSGRIIYERAVLEKETI